MTNPDRIRVKNGTTLATLCAISALVASRGAQGATFEAASMLPDEGAALIDRSLSERMLERRLFAEPYAAIVISTTDIYDQFPFIETRRFELVSDPGWNRIVGAAAGRGVIAYDGFGTSLGLLREPHGLAADEWGRVYIADTGNDRVVVLQASSEYDRLSLRPLFEITGLARPYAVAVSDGGTPFQAADDRLYIADTGHNRVVSYTLQTNGATFSSAIGSLGSGASRFAGPLAIAVACTSGDPVVYVADAHNQRVVRLYDAGDTLEWIDASYLGIGTATAIDLDRWGNLYAASPAENRITKLNPSLEPVATLSTLAAPSALHVPVNTIHDHVSGARHRITEPAAVTVEHWGSGTGLRAWALGLEVRDPVAIVLDRTTVLFELTDRASVEVTLLDSTGASLSTEELPEGDAGTRQVNLPHHAEAASVRITARSAYPDGATVTSEMSLLDSEDAGVPEQSWALLPTRPHPLRGAGLLRLAIPAAPVKPIEVEVFDSSGRRIRSFTQRASHAGLVELDWDGRDALGHELASGLYLYRVQVDNRALEGKLVLLR